MGNEVNFVAEREKFIQAKHKYTIRKDDKQTWLKTVYISVLCLHTRVRQQMKTR